MEIGSEFSTNSITSGDNQYFALSNYPRRNVLSGRTGLSLIANEIKGQISHIALPDYCCGSMIAPFVAHNIQVSFYHAFNYDEVHIHPDAQAVLIMDYFGFLLDTTVTFAQQCKDEGMILIVDATQTAFSRAQTYDLADYILVSYRKWFDSLCAVVYSKKGFTTPEEKHENDNYRKTWRAAAALKEQYLQGLWHDKQKFLTLYGEANQQLEENYIGYKAHDSEIAKMSQVDSQFLKRKRRENTKYLMDEVKKMSKRFNIQPLFEHMGDEDCPLFFPILVEANQRSQIRGEMIKNQIYCPVHWPIDTRYSYCETTYHKTELSLICDQRYGIREMEQEISILYQALALTEK